ncbi:AMP-binding, conserved site,AMP-dependent synthetase/ligase,AMP-binding enzyme, C-terminal domain [Cinara cedri]|uniref:AMP-binding, conserved site,AMP-dependent synthetase/ligase,AMP-binding enzyme, C-terminal domain n=1 Tax=Cinara cedri TaxID=506608 RepID=A0A5E4MHM6_9HEMI|nr:AMP-binding, conserved site,AMP-dependent synthetase/ligase,AMP-binding enzyme, C-terminal domain [Cinara cedri]
MVLLKQWSRLLGHGHLRRTSCIALTNVPGQPIRRQTESKVVHSPFPDVEIPSSLLHEGVWSNLEKWPDKDALVCGFTNRKFTYHEARLASERFAANLRKRGATPGQVIAILLPNIPEFVLSALGAIEAGLTITTINPIYTPYEIAHQLSDSGASGIVTVPELLPKVIEAYKLAKDAGKKSKFIVCVNLDGSKQNGTWDFNEMIDQSVDTSILKSSSRSNSDIVLIPYSSGTTGLSKGVTLSHMNILANIAQMNCPEIRHIEEATANHQDVLPAILPFYHIYGFTVVLMTGLIRGCKMVSLPKLESEIFLNVLKEHKATILYAVPPVVLLLGQNKNVTEEHFQNLRTICNGAGPVKEADAERILVRTKNKNLRFCQAYGMTEASPAVFVSRNTGVDHLTVGPPLPNTLARVVDVIDSTKELGPGEVGEIQVKGPQVMIGYLNNPKATAETLSPEGWLTTGDIGYYNENKDFYIVDRIKELIKVQGYQVPPAELEGLLRTHPNVLDAAVIGVPNDRTGEAPLAYIVLNTDLPAIGEDEVKEFVAGRVAPYKRITAGVHFVDSLPKSAAGKILRRTLKDEYMKTIK